ncbi:hypothetical protein WN51_09826 [Melipona quadrifasciata]|uniref:Uncharacterized protein n=1 Tax=Melipona quadrifasciata TaxID=166423 RepID=A0A0N1ITV9_9HYME|nr:hypothetical protein WN51_09826 [Melipona quadrifasciata]
MCLQQDITVASGPFSETNRTGSREASLCFGKLRNGMDSIVKPTNLCKIPKPADCCNLWIFEPSVEYETYQYLLTIYLLSTNIQNSPVSIYLITGNSNWLNSSTIRRHYNFGRYHSDRSSVSKYEISIILAGVRCYVLHCVPLPSESPVATPLPPPANDQAGLPRGTLDLLVGHQNQPETDALMHTEHQHQHHHHHHHHHGNHKKKRSSQGSHSDEA